jgi:hypothetical protein
LCLGNWAQQGILKQEEKMRPSVDDNLLAASDALEALLMIFPKLKMAEKVDLGARLRAIVKNAGKLDDQIKDDIKERRADKPGTVLGEVFKAILTEVPFPRCDVKALQKEMPKIYADYVVDGSQKRITYEPR